MTIPESLQFKAVSWMSTFDEVDPGDYGEAFIQRYAMTVTIYPYLWFIPTIRHVDMAGNMFTGALEITAGAFSY